MNTLLSYTKHWIKLLIGRPDRYWHFEQFMGTIPAQDKAQAVSILKEADLDATRAPELESPARYEKSTDPLVRQGWMLRQKVLAEFKNKHAGLTGMRILVHVPGEKTSPGGYSLFQNIVEAFRYIGIATEILHVEENKTSEMLHSFKPTILITSDHKAYLDTIDWKAIAEYRKSNTLLIGLTAGLEVYGNTPLPGRIEWAKAHGVDFYYTYRTQEYVNSRAEYRPFHDAGCKIFSLPFGANPLVYYPVPSDMRSNAQKSADQKKFDRNKKDLDYTFIASAQGKSKGKKYFDYLGRIVRRHSGLIAGPGWPQTPDFKFNRDRDRYIYARTKVGLNIHLDEQIQWSCETNERTYQLAACGIPQVTDHAKLLDTLFSPDCLYIADTPKEYLRHFEAILANPKEAERRALKAQKEVFEKYTTFHRASEFATMLATHFKLD